MHQPLRRVYRASEADHGSLRPPFGIKNTQGLTLGSLGLLPSRKRHQRKTSLGPRLYSSVSLHLSIQDHPTVTAHLHSLSYDPAGCGPIGYSLTLCSGTATKAPEIVSLQSEDHAGLALYSPSRRSLNTASRSASAAAFSVGDCNKK